MKSQEIFEVNFIIRYISSEINQCLFQNGELEKEISPGSKERKYYPVDAKQQQKLNLCIVSRRFCLAKL